MISLNIKSLKTIFPPKKGFFRVFLLLFPIFLLFSQTAVAGFSDPPLLVDRYTDPDTMPDFSFPEGKARLEVFFPNTVNADCTILRAGDRVWMVDTGTAYYADRVTDTLRYFGIDRIDCVINTHPHPDHLGALETISEAVPVGELRICFPTDSNDCMREAVAVCKKKDIPIVSYKDGDAWEENGVRFSVRQLTETDLDENNQSAVIRVEYGSRSFLMTADIERRTQYRLAQHADPAFLKTDILRYPHHGMDAMNELMFEKVSPVFAVVSNSKSTYYRGCYFLGCKHVPVAYTNTAYIVLETDGETWLTETRGPDADS